MAIHSSLVWACGDGAGAEDDGGKSGRRQARGVGAIGHADFFAASPHGAHMPQQPIGQREFSPSGRAGARVHGGTISTSKSSRAP